MPFLWRRVHWRRQKLRRGAPHLALSTFTPLSSFFSITRPLERNANLLRQFLFCLSSLHHSTFWQDLCITPVTMLAHYIGARGTEESSTGMANWVYTGLHEVSVACAVVTSSSIRSVRVWVFKQSLKSSSKYEKLPHQCIAIAMMIVAADAR